MTLNTVSVWIRNANSSNTSAVPSSMNLWLYAADINNKQADRLRACRLLVWTGGRGASVQCERKQARRPFPIFWKTSRSFGTWA